MSKSVPCEGFQQHWRSSIYSWVHLHQATRHLEVVSRNRDQSAHSLLPHRQGEVTNSVRLRIRRMLRAISSSNPTRFDINPRSPATHCSLFSPVKCADSSRILVPRVSSLEDGGTSTGTDSLAQQLVSGKINCCLPEGSSITTLK